jgi:hypothetical protein
MRQLRAELYLELSLPLLAIADYEALALTKAQQSKDARVTNYVRIAQIYIYHLMDLMRAKEWAERAFALDQKHVPTLHLIGSLCLINNEFTCAIDFYEKALEIGNNCVSFRLGSCCVFVSFIFIFIFIFFFFRCCCSYLFLTIRLIM